jgi:hypothetical protein
MEERVAFLRRNPRTCPRKMLEHYLLLQRKYSNFSTSERHQQSAFWTNLHNEPIETLAIICYILYTPFHWPPFGQRILQRNCEFISFAFIIIYYFSIGEFLMDFTVLKGQIFFRFNCVYLLLFAMLSSAVSLIGENAILIGVISFYAMIAFLQVVDHLALLLRIRERKEVDN